MYSVLSSDQDERGDAKKAVGQATLSEDDNEDEVRKINALLRYHFKIEPEKLNDRDWLARWAELKYILEFERKRNTF